MTYVEYLRKVRAKFDESKSPTNFICPANARVAWQYPDALGHYTRLNMKIQDVLEAASKNLGTKTALLSTYWIRTGKFGMAANYHMMTDQKRVDMAHAARLAFLDKLIAFEQEVANEFN